MNQPLGGVQPGVPPVVDIAFVTSVAIDELRNVCVGVNVGGSVGDSTVSLTVTDKGKEDGVMISGVEVEVGVCEGIKIGADSVVTKGR